jgi:streptomycin 6-kinase
MDTVAARAELLAPALGVDAIRLLDWCTAFAAMIALELAEAPNASHDRVHAIATLAIEAPTT